MTLGFHHVAISVPDLDEAARWYGAHLGFEVERHFSVPGGTEAMFLCRGGMRIELFRVANPKAMPEDRRHPRRDPGDVGEDGVEHRRSGHLGAIAVVGAHWFGEPRELTSRPGTSRDEASVVEARRRAGESSVMLAGTRGPGRAVDRDVDLVDGRELIREVARDQAREAGRHAGADDQ